MEKSTMPDLNIGDLTINPPIIQGGMGVRISGPNLVSAVSNEGALGVIAAVGTGEDWPDQSLSYPARSRISLKQMILDTKARTKNAIGVNIMSALTNYDDLVAASAEAGVDVIISGAGLPLTLPAMVPDPKIKLIPIVSSGRVAELICRVWSRRYDRLPDAIIVEGPMAGGHLGFKLKELSETGLPTIDDLVVQVLDAVSDYAKDRQIPVIAAGGIFDGGDIARVMALGASGVQMGTRFVCTYECDASDAYKQAYLDSTKDDILLIQSPLKLPLRVVRNDFVNRVMGGAREPVKCVYKCLATCNPADTEYCIARALLNSYLGDMNAGFATCGANAYRCDHLLSVHDLIEELVDGYAAAQ